MDSNGQWKRPEGIQKDSIIAVEYPESEGEIVIPGTFRAHVLEVIGDRIEAHFVYFLDDDFDPSIHPYEEHITINLETGRDELYGAKLKTIELLRP